LAGVTDRWTFGAVSLLIAGIGGCLKPPPAETPNAPLVTQTAGPSSPVGEQAAAKPRDIRPVTPTLGERQKITGAAPEFPAQLRVPGRTYLLYAKICVSKAGLVDSVAIGPGSDPALGAAVVRAVQGWRYRPLTINGGEPLPFCYPAIFKFVQSL
jgi:hypothetical protein